MLKPSDISFIIPALNEEKSIKTTISSIKTTIPEDNPEIIVCDNGSNDRTRDIARESGAIVIIDASATIGELRNQGVIQSKGNVLVFLDADVCLDEDWYQKFKELHSDLPKSDYYITGSVCSTPLNASFLERHWFNNLSKQPKNYINSGHLVTTRKTFDLIGGFDSSLSTSEDYDFCQRAKAAGSYLLPNPILKAYHYGYPKTFSEFFRREAWHGKQDYISITSFLRSTTAIIAVINLLSLFSLCAVMILEEDHFFIFLTAALAMAIPVASALKKFGAKPSANYLILAFIMEIYLLARVSAIFIKNKRKSLVRHQNPHEN